MNIATKHQATILVVDDHPTNVRVVLDTLKDAGFRTLVARSGESALKQVKYARPDMILLDVMMPGIDGFETCRRLKMDETTRDIPIIFMTALSDTVDKLKGFEAGGVDYVTKPFDEVELLARIKAQLALREYQEELKLANRKLLDINRELRTSQEKLELAAKTDPLTRLSNRRDMIEKIEHEISRFKRGQKPFSLVLSDIDDFKHFNDTFGHDCGDFILVTVANIMKSMIRSQDRVARWGGEEFLFLFPETNLEGGRVVAEKIRAHIAGAVYTYKQHALSITLTFGVSVFYSEFLTTDDCIKYADQAMYIGKEHGKNCVIVSPEQESTEMEGENED